MWVCVWPCFRYKSLRWHYHNHRTIISITGGNRSVWLGENERCSCNGCSSWKSVFRICENDFTLWTVCEPYWALRHVWVQRFSIMSAHLSHSFHNNNKTTFQVVKSFTNAKYAKFKLQFSQNQTQHNRMQSGNWIECWVKTFCFFFIRFVFCKIPSTRVGSCCLLILFPFETMSHYVGRYFIRMTEPEILRS